jgi:hypothetical protein
VQVALALAQSFLPTEWLAVEEQELGQEMM